MQYPPPCPGGAAHRATSQGTLHVPISTHPRGAGGQTPRLLPLKALHLRHDGPDGQQPAKVSPEAGTAATTTLPMQRQQQQQRGVGNAMWTVWSETQQFAGNVLSSWSSREASVDGIDNAASSVTSTSGRARLLKDAAEIGTTVRMVVHGCWHGWLPLLLACLPATHPCAAGRAHQRRQTYTQP